VKPANQKLLLISRDTLLKALSGSSGKQQDTDSKQLLRNLAGLSRRGYHILLTAPEPERWVPTRGNVDDALNSQNTLMEETRAAGGELEGVYYVHRSLLTQDRNREGALRDILKRYSLDAGSATLISSSAPFLKAAERLGLTACEVALPGKSGDGLQLVLKKLD